MTRFAVKTILVQSGERLPVLVDRSTGLPVFYPNLYSITELRQTNRASATIARALREIMILLDFLADLGIDLAKRLQEGHLLTVGEIDGLVRHCKQSFQALSLQLPPTGKEKSILVHGRRLIRSKHANQPTTVSLQTSSNRLRTIYAYFSWLINLRLAHMRPKDVVRLSLEQAKISVFPVLLARIPPTKGRNTLGQRQGLHPETLEQLLQIVDPLSQENPWRDDFVRKRNALIVYWLWQLGLRRGELLNVRISDIDFRKNTVMIARRPDDIEDPRKDQPKVKTRDRILPLSAKLAELSHQYITSDRARLPGARNHRYFLVAECTGAPLALSSLNKIFNTLRKKFPNLPDGFSSHVLRHTWNDEFSRRIEEKGISAAEEQQMRSYLMGWSPTSSTACTYTKRYVEEKARRVSLDQQEKIMVIHKNAK